MTEVTHRKRLKAVRGVTALLALGVSVAACFPQDPGVPPATTTTTIPGSTTSTTAAPTTSTTTTTAAPTTTTTTTSTTTTTIPAAPRCTPSAAADPIQIQPSTAPDVTLTAPAPGSGFAFVDTDICWNSANSMNKRGFIHQCKKDPSAVGFNVNVDCSNLSEVTINPGDNPTGYGVYTHVPIFRGLETSGDESWGCYAPGDTAPPGIEKLTTCWIRYTSGVHTNNTDQVAVKIHFNN